LSVGAEFNTLIENSKSNVPGMEITFEGKPVVALETVIVTVRNTGNLDISAEDVLEPITLFAKQCEPLSITLLEGDAEKFTLARNGDQAKLDFRYMAPKDFARVQIMYTNSIEEAFVHYEGKIKDGKIINGSKIERKKAGFLELIILCLCGVALIAANIGGAGLFYMYASDIVLFLVGWATWGISFLVVSVPSISKFTAWITAKLTHRNPAKK